MKILEIGNGYFVQISDLTGIFDLDKTTEERITRDYLAKAEKAGKVITAGPDLPKSFLVMKDGTVYLSKFNPTTLVRRYEEENGLQKEKDTLWMN